MTVVYGPVTAFRIDDQWIVVPPPRRGGTYLYCPWEKWAGFGSVTVCTRSRRCNGTRFRTLAAYRRHWRRHHSGDLQ